MTPLTGWEPDLDETGPGRVLDVTNVIPTIKGLKGAPSQIDAVAGLSALTVQCRGTAILQNTSGTRRHFAGTQTRLYELQSTAWTSIGGTYTGSSENRWLFDQFGNVSLATNNTEKIQWSTTGSFTDITAAPTARVVFTMDNFVMALDTNDPINGDRPDGWACSAYQDYTSWTASVTTQATNGRLIGAGGPLTAGARLGPYAVAYKATSIFVGSYVGAPIVWQWERIPGEIGCIGPEAVCDIGGSHIFVGEDNIWRFDGTRPVSIADGVVRDWFFNNSSVTDRFKTICKYDRQNNNVWIFFPSQSVSSSTVCDQALVYHLPTRKWGKVAIDIEAVVNFSAPGITWDTLTTLSGTWDGLSTIPWDSQTWLAGGRSLAIFNTSHALKAVTGTSNGGTITVGDVGDDDDVTMLRRTRLRFSREPTSATATGYYKMGEGKSLTTGNTISMRDSGFDIRQTGRWHRIAFTLNGEFEATAVRHDLASAGTR